MKSRNGFPRVRAQNLCQPRVCSFFVRNFCAWYTEVADKEIISWIDVLRLSRVRQFDIQHLVFVVHPCTCDYMSDQEHGHEQCGGWNHSGRGRNGRACA